MSHAEKRGNGPYPWRVKYKLPNGKWGSKSGFRTQKEAEDYGDDQETDVRRGVYIDPSSGDMMMEVWIDKWLADLDLKDRSVKVATSALRAQIRPRWEGVAVGEVLEGDVSDWRRKLRKTYSENYVKSIMQTFKILMEDAVAKKMIRELPVAPPNRRRGRYVHVEVEEKEWATPVQVLRMARNAEAIWGPVGYAFVLTKAYTGMRMGEMYGLGREFCLSDAYPDSIRVEWQHDYVGGKPKLTEPKYGSRRTLVLPPFLIGVLERALESHTSQWVFPAMRGGPLRGANFYEDYWPVITRGAPERKGRFARQEILPVEGLVDLTPHGLRHGHKVWLDEADLPRVAVEKRMGHKLDGVEGVYSHVSPGMQRRISAVLERVWQKSLREAGGRGGEAPRS